MATMYVPEDMDAWLAGLSQYKNYGDDMNAWFKQHSDVKVPRLATVKGQILALVTDPNHKDLLFTRAMMDGFLTKIGKQSKDVIQAINKTDQWGLVHKTQDRQFYCIPRPFEYTDVHLKKRNSFGSELDKDDKSSLVRKAKGWLKKYYMDVPEEKWELGHKDPLGSNAVSNLVMQPPIQKAFRDRFKFDSYGLRLCPTALELTSNLKKYYTKAELEMLKDALCAM
jgi:hypothetical protein